MIELLKSDEWLRSYFEATSCLSNMIIPVLGDFLRFNYAPQSIKKNKLQTIAYLK